MTLLMDKPRGTRGYWYTDFRVGEDSRRVRVSSKLKDKGRAEEFAARLKARMEGLVEAESDVPTLGDAYERLFRDDWGNLKDAANKRQLCDCAVSFFGGTFPIDEITRPELVKYVEYLASIGNAPGTVNRKLSVITSMMRRAQNDWGVDLVVPQAPRRKEPTGRLRYLRKDEIKALLDAEDDPQYRLLWTFLLDTGARVSEALNLTWKNVDLDRKAVFFPDTKNGETRSVPLDERMLRELRVQQGKSSREPFPWVYTSVWQHFDHTRYKAGLADGEVCIHTLRHTCATMLLASGVDIRVAQVWLGHKTIQQTMRYTKVAPEMMAEALEKRTAKGIY